jgi:hypothetical protein
MCFETLLGHSVIRFEFNPHIVELGSDHFRHFSTTESAMQLRLRGKTTPDLYIIIFTNLKKKKQKQNMVIMVTRLKSTR